MNEQSPDQEAVSIEVASRALFQALVRASEAPPAVVSGAQLSALRVIERRRQLNMTELAADLDTIPSWASRLCDRLEADGYIERRLSETTRREVTIQLRAAGVRVLEDVAQRRAETLASVLGAMTAADRKALRRGLEAFTRARGHNGGAQTESA